VWRRVVKTFVPSSHHDTQRFSETGENSPLFGEEIPVSKKLEIDGLKPSISNQSRRPRASIGLRRGVLSHRQTAVFSLPSARGLVDRVRGS